MGLTRPHHLQPVSHSQGSEPRELHLIALTVLGGHHPEWLAWLESTQEVIDRGELSWPSSQFALVGPRDHEVSGHLPALGWGYYPPGREGQAIDAKSLAFPQGAHPRAEEDGGPLRNFQDLCGQGEGPPPGQGFTQQQRLDEADMLRGGGDILHVNLQGGRNPDHGPAHCGGGRSLSGGAACSLQSALHPQTRALAWLTFLSLSFLPCQHFPTLPDSLPTLAFFKKFIIESFKHL